MFARSRSLIEDFGRHNRSCKNTLACKVNCEVFRIKANASYYLNEPTLFKLQIDVKKSKQWISRRTANESIFLAIHTDGWSS